MRPIFGLLLVMLGLAMAVLWMPEHNGERQLAEITDIATKGIAPSRVSNADERTQRTFSPATPLLATVEPPGAKQHVAAIARVAPGSLVATVPPSALVVVPSTTSGSQQTSAVIAGPAPRSHDAMAPVASSVEMKRDELVRNIQSELKRVGCYAGDVDGNWGAGSKRAMSAFTGRVNATLPVEQPDIILFTLLRGHSGTACGKQPGTVIAAPLAPRATERSNATARNSAQSLQAAAAPALRPSPEGSWNATVKRSDGITTLPLPQAAVPRVAIVGPQQAEPYAPPVGKQIPTAQIATVAPSSSPLPGRMAIGGPVAPLASVQERSPARGAVPAATQEQPAVAAPSATPARSRAKRRSSGYVYYRVPVPAVAIYAGPRYASAAPRRGRSWTGSFFGTP